MFIIKLTNLCRQETVLTIRHHLYIYYILFSDQVCSHCKVFQSSNINDWIEHCKSCKFMPRPDAFRHKYVCFACTYYSYNIGNIKRHLNIHLGEKPYMCHLCDYSCRETHSLKLHMKKYHGWLNRRYFQTFQLNKFILFIY